MDLPRSTTTGCFFRAWRPGWPAQDLRLVAATDTVDGLLGLGTDGIDVVLLDLLLADRCNTPDNVRRVAAAGPRVLMVSVVADPGQIMSAYAAGAAGYLTKDHDLDEVADAVRDLAAGRDPCPPELAFAMAHDKHPARPRLSAQERLLLLAYAAGMTLDAAARRIGIRPATAKHYLEVGEQRALGLGLSIRGARAAGERGGVTLVHPHVGPGLPGRGHDPRVVGMRMGQQDCADVAKRAAGTLQV